jgi:hypothetical protein
MNMKTEQLPVQLPHRTRKTCSNCLKKLSTKKFAEVELVDTSNFKTILNTFQVD